MDRRMKEQVKEPGASRVIIAWMEEIAGNSDSTVVTK